MSLLLTELCDRMKLIEEIELVDKLGLTSDDIVDRCVDLIEERYDEFLEEFNEIEGEE